MMSFQAYLDTIAARTGKGPDDFRVLANDLGLADNGMLKTDVKAGQVVVWLKEDFGLGSWPCHGYPCAVEGVEKS